MKIALVGRYPKTFLQAPCDDPEWEIWATGALSFGALPRVDAWFELHKWSENRGQFADVIRDDARYLDWLKVQPRVYIHGGGDEFPGAMAYPFAEMHEIYGPYFFSCTPAWMMALALTREPEAIGIWGIEMSSESEHVLYRTGFHHFVQIAHDRGIEIIIPEGSTILDAVPYGHDRQVDLNRLRA